VRSGARGHSHAREGGSAPALSATACRRVHMCARRASSAAGARSGSSSHDAPRLPRYHHSFTCWPRGPPAVSLRRAPLAIWNTARFAAHTALRLPHARPPPNHARDRSTTLRGVRHVSVTTGRTRNNRARGGGEAVSFTVRPPCDNTAGARRSAGMRASAAEVLRAAAATACVVHCRLIRVIVLYQSAGVDAACHQQQRHAQHVLSPPRARPSGAYAR
jgi:hypothetical protein